MGAITKDMVECAYEVGKKVYTGEFGRTDGKKEINLRTGMDTGSANDYITVLMNILNGQEYHRTINAMATEYYLEQIGLDFGRESQQKAAMAVLMHTKYYSTLGHGNQVKIEKLAKKYI